CAGCVGCPPPRSRETQARRASPTPVAAAAALCSTHPLSPTLRGACAAPPLKSIGGAPSQLAKSCKQRGQSGSGVGSTDGAQAAGPRAHSGQVVRNEARDADTRRLARQPRLLQRRRLRGDRALVSRRREIARLALV